MPKEPLSPLGDRASGTPATASGWHVIPPLAFAAFFALCLAICAADLFIPFFWERRLLLRWAFLLLVTIPATAVLAPVAHRFVRRASSRAPAQRPWWYLALAVLLATAGLVFYSAVVRQSAALSLVASGSLSETVYPPADFRLEFIYLFLLLTCIAMAYADLVARRLDAERRIQFSLLFLGLCFIGIHIANSVLSEIDTTTNLWNFRNTFFHSYTSSSPIGIDFREGIYLPSKALLSGQSPYSVPSFYPPLVSLLGLPYLLLDQDHAYFVHVLLLVLANLGCLGLATALARRAYLTPAVAGTEYAFAISLVIFVLLAYDVLSSYPFVFSFDRGNVDIFAMLFGLAAVLLALRAPDRVWLPVILLSIAVQIKIYPAFLFAVLYFLQRRRIVLPALLSNFVFLFILGPTNAAVFVKSLLTYYQPVVTTYNHSGYSFATLLGTDLPALAPLVPVARLVFTLLPLALWLAAWPALLHLGSRTQTAVSAAMITVPVMVAIPAIGNDYQLVVLWSAILLLLTRLLFRMRLSQSVADYVRLLALAALVLIFGRSDVLMGSQLALIQDKYLWLVLLEILMLVDIHTQLFESAASAGTLRGAVTVGH